MTKHTNNTKIKALSDEDLEFFLQTVASKGANLTDKKLVSRYKRILVRPATIEDTFILAERYAIDSSRQVMASLQDMILGLANAQNAQTALLKGLGVTDEQIEEAVQNVERENDAMLEAHRAKILAYQEEQKAEQEEAKEETNEVKEEVKAPKKRAPRKKKADVVGKMTIVENETSVDLSVKGK